MWEVLKSMEDMYLGRHSDNSNIVSNTPVDLAPPWFTEYMETLKQDIVNEVSSKVVKNISDILNKPTLELRTVPRSEDPVELQGEAAAFGFKQNPNYSHSEEKKQYKKKKKAMEKRRAIDIPLKYNQLFSRNFKTIEAHRIMLQQQIYCQLKCLQQKVSTRLEEEKRIAEKRRKVFDLLESSIKQNGVAAEEESDGQSISLPRRAKNSYIAQDGGLDEDVGNEVQAYSNGDIRMNCSITGHQMLNKSALTGTTECSDSDIDNASTSYDAANISDREEEHNFETIQMPSECAINNSDCASCAGNALQNKPGVVPPVPSNKKLNFQCFDEDNNESSSDSPSFELLAETPSPPTSIFIDEDHFSKNENNAGPSTSFDSDMRENSLYAISLTQKAYDKSLPGDYEKCLDSNKESSADDACSSTSEPVFLVDDSTSMIDWEHCSRSKNTKEPSIDVKTSHTSYPVDMERIEVERADISQVPRGCYQSQSDPADFTRSFDSHTTSVTDSGAYVANGAHSGVNQKCTKRATLECRRKDDSMENECRHALVVRDRSQEKVERVTKKGDKRQCAAEGGKCFCKEQSENREGADARQLSPEEAPGVTDPVLILPETLMTNAAHVASLAYGTAREMLVKIRVRTVNQQSSKQ
ncbi:hypothetical protein KM043_010567 [Ampulex compressa]|nr:hypothetical protein KM043_010567 [Ampulex compressa]